MHGRTIQTFIADALEPRRFLSVVAPTLPATIGTNPSRQNPFIARFAGGINESNMLNFAFTDTNTTETGYEVQRHEPLLGWVTPPNGILGAVAEFGATVLYTEELPGGEDLEYRVRA